MPTYAYKTTLWSGFGPTGDAADFTNIDGSTLISGPYSTLIGGSVVTATAGDNSILRGGWGCNLTAGANSILIAGRFSAVVGGLGSSAQGGYQTSITLQGTAGPVTATVKDSSGLNGTLEANTLYCLGANNQFGISPAIIPPLPPYPSIPGIPPTPDPSILPVGLIETAGDNATLVGGEAATLTAGNRATITAGTISTLTTGDNSTISTGAASNVTTGNYCTVVAGTYVLQFPPPPPLPTGTNAMTVEDFCFVVAYGASNTLTAVSGGHFPPPNTPPFNPTGGTGGMKQTISGDPPRCIPNPFDKCLSELLKAPARAISICKAKARLYRQQKWPFLRIPYQGLRLQKSAAVPMPDPASGFVPVLSFLVPAGYDLSLTSLFQFFTGAFQQGSGDLVWALQVGRIYAKNFGQTIVQLGSGENPYPIEGSIIVRSQDRVTYWVENTNAAALPPGVGNIVCGLQGWTYPRK